MFNLPSIKRLDLGLSKLQGTIPYDFVNVKKLEHLDLHGNEKITGQLPSCFGNLCKLKTLDLSGNNFSGNIDGFLGNFPTCLNNNLESLALHSYNKLIGKIPDSLGIFGSLRQLSLGYNFFGGSIPASIGKLSSLQLLHLSYKEMNGTIPKSIGQLSELSHFAPWQQFLKRCHYRSPFDESHKTRRFYTKHWEKPVASSIQCGIRMSSSFYAQRASTRKQCCWPQISCMASSSKWA